MVLSSEDDFGRTRKQLGHTSHRRAGDMPPRNWIGARVSDLPDEKPVRPHQADLQQSSLDMILCPKKVVPFRKLKKPTVNESGEPVDCQRPAPDLPQRRGLRHIDYVPSKMPLHDIFPSSKKNFEWVQGQKTGWNNPRQYESVPSADGSRPSHPVSVNGVVALEHRRCYPELQHQETGIPPPLYCKAPSGSTWGGWATGGVPGRASQKGPWDSLVKECGGAENEPDEWRFSDARTKHYPEMRNGLETFVHTRWHMHPVQDLNAQGQKLVHQNMPAPGAGKPDHHRPPAGRATGMVSEGVCLPYYEKARAADLTFSAPHTAR